jgi:hypothetical protein
VGSYLATVILVPIGLVTQHLVLIFAGLPVTVLFGLIVVVAAPLNMLLTPESPKEIAHIDCLQFLNMVNFYALAVVIIPGLMLLALFLTYVLGHAPVLSLAILAVFFEISYVLFGSIWRFFRILVLGMTSELGTVAFAWLAWMLLSSSNRIGLSYLYTAFQFGRRGFLDRSISWNYLDKLIITISLCELHVRQLPFEDLSRLAHSLTELPFYQRFFDTAQEFLENPNVNWIQGFRYTKANPGRFVRIGGLAVNLIIILIGLTTEQFKTYLSTVIQGATTGAVGGLILAFVAFFGYPFVAARATLDFSNRVDKEHLVMLQRKWFEDKHLDEFIHKP